MTAWLKAEVERMSERIARLEAGKIGWVVGVSALLLALLYVDNRIRGMEANQALLYQKLDEKLDDVLERLPLVGGAQVELLPVPTLKYSPYWWRDGVWV